ncbi:MAG: uracil phosphoribosyltransferase [Planctomycetota bacterium]|nr:uracil phosphoribosyltransferase [Planctomycetota bacterium]MSR40088.1 uracil phosphoribosyltransferase [Planctomycetota bacterium]
MGMLTHHYGPNVYIMDDTYLLTLLAKLGAPETGTAAVPILVRAAYHRLVQEVLASEFPTVEARIKTRMAATEPQGFYQGPMLCSDTRLVICSVIRAGILPSQTCYETATSVLPPQNVRVDFLNISRVVDESKHVVGVRLDGSKLGGSVEGAIILIPDPMGATGSTVCRVVDVYKASAEGTPKAIIALHLMATPEALQRVGAMHPEVKIYTARFDRGLSPPEVLLAAPGLYADRERGLNDVQYVVPGAGGLGELLTNSWV